MAFFPSVPPDFSGSPLIVKYPKRAVMHVDQVVIQTEQLQRIATHGVRQVPSVPVDSIEFMNDQSCEPPQRKRMKHDSNCSQKNMNGQGKAHGMRSIVKQIGTTTHLRNEKGSREESKSSLVLRNHASKNVSDRCNKIFLDADCQWLQERALEHTGQAADLKRGNLFRKLRHTKRQDTSMLLPPPEPYANQPNAFTSHTPPVEVQIQECPGLPKMRAYVVVPLGKIGTQERDVVERAARRAANAVPPCLRATRRPQAIIVQCDRQNLSVTGTIPYNTTFPLPIESAPKSGSASAHYHATCPSTTPATSSDNAAITPANAAAFAGQSGDAAAGQIITEKLVAAESLSKITHESSEASRIDEDQHDLKVVSVATILASMDCCTFICKVPNVLDTIDKHRQRSRTTNSTSMSQETEATKG